MINYLSRLEIDDQFEVSRLFRWNVAGACASQQLLLAWEFRRA